MFKDIFPSNLNNKLIFLFRESDAILNLINGVWGKAPRRVAGAPAPVYFPHPWGGGRGWG